MLSRRNSQSRKKGQEAREGAATDTWIFLEDAFFPVPEPEPVVVRSSSEVNDEAHDDENDEKQDLDCRKDDFRLSEPCQKQMSMTSACKNASAAYVRTSNATEIERDHCSEANGDSKSRRDIGPEPDKDSGCRELRCD